MSEHPVAAAGDPTNDPLARHFPPLGVVVRTGELTLRMLRDQDAEELAELLSGGVHDPNYMPFTEPWTDAAPADMVANSLRFQWSRRAGFTREKWTLEFGVWHRGRLVGFQSLGATDFLITRKATTGSWLGLAHQGQGIGKAMRRAVCIFAFDHLGALRIVSAAYADNHASIGVSRAVGYQANGQDWRVRRGQPIEDALFVVTPQTLIRDNLDVEVEGLAPLRAFLGLD